MCPGMYRLDAYIQFVLPQSFVALARMQLTTGRPICELQRYRELSPGLTVLHFICSCYKLTVGQILFEVQKN